jgi:hypothetical protein
MSRWMDMQENNCDETILTSELPAMAAVYGIISRLGSLVIPLVAVSHVEITSAVKEPDLCSMSLHRPPGAGHGGIA